jgi:predicted RNA-binding Zn ribbon-like protein
VQALAFEWVGGETCLDFNNTVSWSTKELTQERLRSREDLPAWGKAAGLSPESGPRGDPRRTLAEALVLRETLHRIFSPLSRWHAPSPDDLAEFNRFLTRALSRLRVARGKGTFAWDFFDSGLSGDRLDPILAEVVWSAARLLTSPDLKLLRACANPECGWLFLDRSRRKNRRWCEMRECGNRAKARRYYRRHSAKKVRSTA